MPSHECFCLLSLSSAFTSQNVTSGKTNRMPTTRSNEFPSCLDEFPSNTERSITPSWQGSSEV